MRSGREAAVAKFPERAGRQSFERQIRQQIVVGGKVAAHRGRKQARSRLMYSEGGLSRGGREIGALAASFVNRCIYCASVHGPRR